MPCLLMQLETINRIGATSYYRPLPHFLSILVRMRGNEGGVSQGARMYGWLHGGRRWICSVGSSMLEHTTSRSAFS